MQDYSNDRHHDLVPGRLRGYRVWRSNGASALASMTASTYWAESELTAQCLGKGFKSDSTAAHDVPDSGCTCGIYACHTPTDQQFLQMLQQPLVNVPYNVYPHPGNRFLPSFSTGRVAGVIEAWGKVVLGRRGFRAEKARIIAFTAAPSARPFDLDQWNIVSVQCEYGNSGVPHQVVVMRNGYTGEMVSASVDYYAGGYPVNATTYILDHLRKQVEQTIEASSRAVKWLNRYNVPIYTDLAAMVKDFPPIPVDDLLDEKSESYIPDWVNWVNWRIKVDTQKKPAQPL